VKDAGLDSVEIGTGGNPGDEFCPLDELLESEDKRKAYLEKVHERGLTISAFSCHNNHIAPNPKEAQETHETFMKTVNLASLMCVFVVYTFSGTAGCDKKESYPNLAVTPWPNAYKDIWNWQWEKKLIPYWKEQWKLAEDYGVKIGI